MLSENFNSSFLHQDEGVKHSVDKRCVNVEPPVKNKWEKLKERLRALLENNKNLLRHVMKLVLFFLLVVFILSCRGETTVNKMVYLGSICFRNTSYQDYDSYIIAC